VINLKDIEYKYINKRFLESLKENLMDALHKDRCLHCGKTEINKPFFSSPGLPPSYKIHHECLSNFIEYWSVMLLGDYKPIAPEQQLYKSIYLSEEILTQTKNLEDMFISLGHNFVQDYLHALHTNSIQILDIRASLQNNPNALASTLIINIRYRPLCMFCGNSLIVNNVSFKPWEQTDPIFPYQRTKFEDLKQSEDNKYTFHTSCLNNAINLLKSYPGGTNEE